MYVLNETNCKKRKNHYVRKRKSAESCGKETYSEGDESRILDETPDQVPLLHSRQIALDVWVTVTLQNGFGLLGAGRVVGDVNGQSFPKKNNQTKCIFVIHINSSKFIFKDKTTFAVHIN